MVRIPSILQKKLFYRKELIFSCFPQPGCTNCAHRQSLNPCSVQFITCKLMCNNVSDKEQQCHTNLHNQKNSFISDKLATSARKSLASSLVDRSPVTLQPYMKLMRMDRPIGSWLLFWPCGWSIALATEVNSMPDFKSLTLCAVGAVIMRGAGCTINDMWDRDIDSKVARTKDRPLVSGTISMKDAVIFLSGQLGLGLLVLLQFNWYTVVLGASSLGLVITYPLMKRITYWPQLVLGLTFNWGALLGWSAVHGVCNWTVCLPLYAAGVSWTIIYDTIYAHQDKTDDQRLGIKSTALKFGDHTQLWLTGFASTMVGGLVLAGLNSQQAWPYYASVSLVSAHIANQLFTLDVHNPIDCGSKFVSNKYVGLFLFLGVIMSSLLKNDSKLLLKESSSKIIESDKPLNLL